MIPAKVKDFIPEVAEQIGIPEEDLSNMISFYFKEVRDTLSDLDYLHVVLRGLGNMMLKGWDIEKEIEDQRRKLSRATSEASIQDLKDNIERLERIKVEWDRERQTKKEASEKKKLYYAIKNSNDESQEQAKSTVG